MVENSIFNNIHFIQSLTINCTNAHALNNEQLEKKNSILMLSPSGITDSINNEFLKCQGYTDRMNHYKTLWSKNPIDFNLNHIIIFL